MTSNTMLGNLRNSFHARNSNPFYPSISPINLLNDQSPISIRNVPPLNEFISIPSQARTLRGNNLIASQNGNNNSHGNVSNHSENFQNIEEIERISNAGSMASFYFPEHEEPADPIEPIDPEEPEEPGQPEQSEQDEQLEEQEDEDEDEQENDNSNYSEEAEKSSFSNKFEGRNSLIKNDLPSLKFNLEKLKYEPISQIYAHKKQSRPLSAPLIPLNEIEEFKRSKEFYLIEKIEILSNQLVLKPDNKFDLDSKKGKKICKKYLRTLEDLCRILKVKTVSRIYRNQFSNSYKILYKEGALSYLNEILDSAQEGFPHLWVNGEKYIFPRSVLEAGEVLFQTFCNTKASLHSIYNKFFEENLGISNSIKEILKEMAEKLEKLDINWSKFEEIYVFELMSIENDARKLIVSSFEIEKELKAFEIKERIKGKIFSLLDSKDYNELRKKLSLNMAKINSVANCEGNGREDLGVEILLKAESIMRRISVNQSRAVRKLAENIKKSFSDFRSLLQKYEQNIESLDPQLKNNPDLVEILIQYEKNWERGKEFLLDNKKCTQFINFSQIIESVSEKYKSLRDKIDSMDTELFMLVPCITILNAIDGSDKSICITYLPTLEDSNSSDFQLFHNIMSKYEELEMKCKDQFLVFNLVEKMIMEIEINWEENEIKKMKHILNEIVKGIRLLSINLQRNSPKDWNYLLDAILNHI